MRKLIALLVTAAGAMAAGSAHAGDVYWSVGISSPGIGTVISNAPPAPVYVAPAPVVYAPPAVVYVPPPRVVYRPVPVYTAPRVVYQPVPVVVHGAGHGHYRHHRHHHRHHHHGGYHHGGRNIVAIQTVDYTRHRH